MFKRILEFVTLRWLWDRRRGTKRGTKRNRGRRR